MAPHTSVIVGVLDSLEAVAQWAAVGSEQDSAALGDRTRLAKIARSRSGSASFGAALHQYQCGIGRKIQVVR